MSVMQRRISLHFGCLSRSVCMRGSPPIFQASRHSPNGTSSAIVWNARVRSVGWAMLS